MSFAVTAVVATVAVGYQAYQAKEAREDAKDAQNEARRRADEAAAKADQDYNRVNKKKPNVQGIMNANAASAAGSTMLTGPQGVDLNSLLLGKNTLLGQ